MHGHLPVRGSGLYSMQLTYITQIVGCLTAVEFQTKALTGASLTLRLAIREFLVTSLCYARIEYGKSKLLKMGDF